MAGTFPSWAGRCAGYEVRIFPHLFFCRLRPMEALSRAGSVFCLR